MKYSIFATEPNLVLAKLSVPETTEINLSDTKLNQLRMQITTELLPTLRVTEVNDFNIEETFGLLSDYAKTHLQIEAL